MDLGKQLQFSAPENVETTRPSHVVRGLHDSPLVQLSVTLEGGWRLLMSGSEPSMLTWKAVMCPMEMGCGGFVGSSTAHLLHSMKCRGARHREAVKELAEEAKIGSFGCG